MDRAGAARVRDGCPARGGSGAARGAYQEVEV